jgi:hypothetical protein
MDLSLVHKIVCLIFKEGAKTLPAIFPQRLLFG